MNKKSILEIGRGAIKESVDYEMRKIIDNIMDANTSPTAKRKLTLTMVFAPNTERQNIAIDVSTKSTLAPINSVQTFLHITGDPAAGEVRAVEMVPQIPGQCSMEGYEMEEPAVLNVTDFKKAR